MAFSINRVTLVGNVSQDPQLTYTPKGTAVLKFNMATNWRKKNDATGQWEDVPSFHRITAWAGLAEFLGKGNLHKGDQVYLDGRIEYGNYEKDGVTRYTTDIIAQNIIPMRDRSGRGNYQQQGGVNQAPSTPAPAASAAPASAPAALAKDEPKQAEKKGDTKPKQTSKPAQENVPVDDIPF